MSRDPHFIGLERMYLSAAVNEFYKPRITIDDGECSIEIDVAERFFHAAQAVHGSVYFKLMDDAGYFAANSLERERFVLTATFTTYLTRPVQSGVMRAVGRVVHRTRSQFIADTLIHDGEDIEVSRGTGVYVRSGSALRDIPGYKID